MLTGWNNDEYPTRRGYPPEQVREHCVRNETWQILRIRLKGKPTHTKLQMLQDYWCMNQFNRVRGKGRFESSWAVEVQVGNYLGALRRGGQLDKNNQVRKYI